jgi:hypothetical protein
MDGIGWDGTGSQARWVRAMAHLHRRRKGRPIPRAGWHAIVGGQTRDICAGMDTASPLVRLPL